MVDLIGRFYRGTQMIDLSSQGMKCRAVRTIESYQGIVRASTEGTIQYEIENLGRHLVNVHWDNGLRLNVFADEIEIIDGDLFWQ
jgi:hypothetical protein